MVNFGAVLGGGVFVLIGLGAFWQGYNRMERTGAVSPDGATRVSDLVPNEWAQVEGTVRPADSDPLPAQIAGTEGFVVRTELERSSSNNRLFHRQIDAVPFEVRDRTGTVRVEPPDDVMDTAFGFGQGAIGVPGKVDHIKAEYHLEDVVLDDFDSVPERAWEWAETQAPDLEDYPGGANKLKQGVVEPGDTVVVYGKVHRHPSADPDSPAMKLDDGGEPKRFVLADAGVEVIEGTVKREEYVRFGFALLFVLFGLLFIGVGVFAG